MNYHNFLQQFFAALLSIFPLVMYGQCDTCYIEYHNMAHDAEYLLYERKDIKKASHLLKKAINLVPTPYPKDVYNLAKCMALLNKEKKTVKCIKKIESTKGSSIYYVINRDSTAFSVIFDKKKFKTYFNRLKTDAERDIQIVSKPSNEYQQKLMDTLNYFINTDKVFRGKTKFPQGKDIKWWKEFEQSDYGLFHQEFVQYVEENGYPGYLKTGTQSEFLTALLIHLSEKQTRKLYPTMIKELKKGHVSPSVMNIFLGTMKHDYDNKPCQYYINIRGDRHICNLTAADWKEIITNRLSIGASIYYNTSYNRIRPEEKFEKLPYLY